MASVELVNVAKQYGKQTVLHPLDLTIPDGSFTVLVGPSGCGKSTLLRLLAGLESLSAGTILMNSRPINDLDPADRDVAMVFQSYALYPHLTVAENLAFHMQVKKVDKATQKNKVQHIASMLGIDKLLGRYPRALSGGQRQRVNIARALAMKPRLVILDEAVSALDKSVEAQVLQLLQELKRTLELTYVFISHDLHVVRWLSDRILVMYLGEVVEIGPAEQLFTASAHPYTRALLSSMPSMDPQNRTLTSPLNGDPPSPISPPSGCRFHTRCPHARAVCAEVKPVLESVGEGHQSACLMAQPSSPWHQNITIQEVSYVG